MEAAGEGDLEFIQRRSQLFSFSFFFSTMHDTHARTHTQTHKDPLLLPLPLLLLLPPPPLLLLLVFPLLRPVGSRPSLFRFRCTCAGGAASRTRLRTGWALLANGGDYDEAKRWEMRRARWLVDLDARVDRVSRDDAVADGR